VKAWDTKLHLGGWTTADSVAPSTRQYLTHPVPWDPLETEDYSRDKLEEAAGEREPSELAAACLAILGKRNISDITKEKTVV
jgi:hypothetical protein